MVIDKWQHHVGGNSKKFSTQVDYSEDNDKITTPTHRLFARIYDSRHEVIVVKMEDPETRSERQERVEDLHLDRVVASQPEIGPTPPDGGYGWLIVTSAVIYNVTVPTILMLYGLIILKSLREEDHEEGEKMRVWDVDVALVPVILTVIRLLLESWCWTVAKIFNMPRFTALAGLCMSVAGVLLSSYATSVYSNDHIVNIFAGILIGKILNYITRLHKRVFIYLSIQPLRYRYIRDPIKSMIPN